MIYNTENLKKLFGFLLSGHSSKADEKLIRDAFDEYIKLESADFWSNWVYPEGANPFNVQDELADYHMILENVSEVYMHVTGGRISKPNTLAYEVISIADDVVSKIVKDEIKEALDAG